MKGFESRQSLSFSHVDVDDAFQFINNISANPYRPAVSCLLSGLYDLQTEMRRLRRHVKKKTKRLREANRRYKIDELKRVAYVYFNLKPEIGGSPPASDVSIGV